MDKIVSLAKRRGFVFQSSEIYGGLNGCWDFGPLGVELLNNIKQSWWQAMTYRDDVEGLDASILMHPKVWEASGHVENFTDPMVDCKQCKARYRVDLLFESLPKKSKKHIEDKIRTTLTSEIAEVNEISINNYFSDNIDHFTADITCPTCGNTGTFTNARKFNLMFKTYMGAIESEDSIAYLRPETAQGIFVNYGNVKESTRQKLPFGIAQIGKAFRNEINTKNFLFRVREFEQMEMQYFVKPGSDDDLYNEWKERRIQWWVDLGIKRENLNFAPHPADKLAHYAKAAVDIEFKFPFGFGEIEGIHNRSDFDLSQHTKFSGKKLWASIFKRRFYK